MSIGNIPKDIRRKPTQRAQMLMGYIPTTQLEYIKNKSAQRRALANLFHACMHKLLSPIESYGETSIAMVTSNGTAVTRFSQHLLVTTPNSHLSPAHKMEDALNALSHEANLQATRPSPCRIFEKPGMCFHYVMAI
jgi:hypothetical protein